MNFGERAEARRKAKELKNEMKQLKKELLAVGCEKGTVSTALKDFAGALELGETLRTEYAGARGHMKGAREQIDQLLLCMGESTEEEVGVRLGNLLEELGQVCHECLLRKDDPDFQSSVRGVKKMAGERAQADRSGMAAIMLRSELENIRAVLNDAMVWEAPDFFALAYFLLHGNKGSLKEMENRQRNVYVSAYTKEHFTDAFLRECGKAGVDARAEELIQKYT